MKKDWFASMIGYEGVKDELNRLVDRLSDPAKYAAFGVSEPHGLLFHGAPGVGKSSFARAFADACGRRTFVCRKDKPNGSFVQEIVRVFDEAAQHTPSLILLDDLDKFASEDQFNADAEEFVTVQSCIDRVKDLSVFVVATVNNMHKLPDSLVRAGRFDHVLPLNTPDGADAQAIVSHYLAQKPYVADMDMRRIARLLEGRSCADLEVIINQAGAYAAYDGREQVEMKDLIRAVLREVFEVPEQPHARRESWPLVACHEAGHTLAAELLEPGSVDLVSILGSGSTAGVTALYRAENYFHSKALMEVRVMSLLAGKAATEICFGVVDTGANSDLGRAFNIVHRFVDDYCEFGFEQYVFNERQSNEMLRNRDTRVAAEMQQYYNRVRQLLLENKDKLDELRTRLLEEQTLLGDDIERIVFGTTELECLQNGIGA